MQEHAKHGRVGQALLRAGMHRNTGAKYVKAGTVPSALKQPRTRRTREDPFDEHWPELAARLEAAPELETTALFEDLCEPYPGRYQEGQVRTLQRRVRQWRALYGPEKLLFFEQRHRSGEAMQLDYTYDDAGRLTGVDEGAPPGRPLRALSYGGSSTTSDWANGKLTSATSYSYFDDTVPPSGGGSTGDLIFADGFESGDTSAWSATVPAPGSLIVSGRAVEFHQAVWVTPSGDPVPRERAAADDITGGSGIAVQFHPVDRRDESGN